MIWKRKTLLTRAWASQRIYCPVKSLIPGILCVKPLESRFYWQPADSRDFSEKRNKKDARPNQPGRGWFYSHSTVLAPVYANSTNGPSAPLWTASRSLFRLVRVVRDIPGHVL